MVDGTASLDKGRNPEKSVLGEEMWSLVQELFVRNADNVLVSKVADVVMAELRVEINEATYAVTFEALGKVSELGRSGELMIEDTGRRVRRMPKDSTYLKTVIKDQGYVGNREDEMGDEEARKILDKIKTGENIKVLNPEIDRREGDMTWREATDNNLLKSE